MPKLYLYSLFHLNLAFSLIPEEDYTEIVDRCYMPLLELAEEGLPVAIEATALTLEEIGKRRPQFVDRLARLWQEGKCEFVGSGYSQLIMPLVPSDVNRWNLEFGMEHYGRLLGKRPETALVNEQTFSRGLVELFKECGYRRIIMDWSNCYRYNRYPKSFLYYPQIARGSKEGIEVVWNHSIAFQKFQRCVHGEIDLEEYLDYLLSHRSQEEDRAFLIYGNDAEVFGYRPGSGEFKQGEKERLKEILLKVASIEGVAILRPSEIAEHFKGHPLAYNPIALESTETPLVCKKQEKYNPVRWAVSGRDNAHINAACYEVYHRLKGLESSMEGSTLKPLRKTLCELWGSDFRTNTIDEKFLYFRDLMGWLKHETSRLYVDSMADYNRMAKSANPSLKPKGRTGGLGGGLSGMGGFPVVLLNSPPVVVEKRGNRLLLETPAVKAEFLAHKGLAISSLVFKTLSPRPLIGTLPHGYYEDIHLGADFFSAHMINILGDGGKVTDLIGVVPDVSEEEEFLRVSTEITLPIGRLKKSYRVWKDVDRVDVDYKLRVKGLVASSLRVGIFTFLPEGFDRASLWYETINGGLFPERFYLAGHRVAQDEPVNYRVSAKGCLGATEGWIRVGDKDRAVEIWTDKSQLYSVPMVHYQETEDSFFFRIYHSVGETDETAWWIWRGINSISFTIRALNGGE